jgi:hypothetical protein
MQITPSEASTLRDAFGIVQRILDEAARSAGHQGGASPGASTPRPAAPARPPGEGPRATFGRQKGDLLADLTGDNLRWLRDVLRQSLADPEKARFSAANRKQLAEVEGEMRGRFLE